MRVQPSGPENPGVGGPGWSARMTSLRLRAEPGVKPSQGIGGGLVVQRPRLARGGPCGGGGGQPPPGPEPDRRPPPPPGQGGGDGQQGLVDFPAGAAGGGG